MASTFTLAKIAEHLGLALPKDADGSLKITAVKPLHEAEAGELSFLDNPKYANTAKNTKASAVFITAEQVEHLPQDSIALITPTPYLAFAQSLMLLYPQKINPGIHPTAVISKTATVDPTAEIGAYVTIGDNVTIGAQTHIHAHVNIQHTTIGVHCIIHPGAQIGQDGFGFAEHEGAIVKIPQVGSVVIGDHVEVGANTTIDRGALGATTIGNGTKLDNQVQIGHNATLGDNVRICGQSGIAGSATLGHNCLIGAQSGVSGHIVIAPYTTLAAKSALLKNVSESHQTFAGMPAVPIQQWRRQAAAAARQVKKPESKN